MPTNYQVLGAILRAFPRATVIHCRRDPVDTCLSVYTTPYRSAPEFGHDREDIVFAYRLYERLMLHWQHEFPDARILNVDYERLVEEPDAVTREMIGFAGLDWSDSCLQPGRLDRAVNTPSAWQVRQPIYKGSVARWRNYEPWLGAFRQLLLGS
jgi:hypothetical protein